MWLVCIALVLHFRSSEHMGVSYGLSITVPILIMYSILEKTPNNA